MNAWVANTGALAAAAVLAASSAGKPSFHGTDITGADFGRDPSLTDHNGRPRTLADFRGSAVVLYFGYTSCPDVRPTTLAEMKQVKAALGSDGDRLQVLFATIDPERDTPELLANYVPAFDPRFLGLRGDAAATERTAAEFKVFFLKVPGATPGSYTMNHTAGRYVYDPKGTCDSSRRIARARGARARHRAAARTRLTALRSLPLVRAALSYGAEEFG